MNKTTISIAILIILYAVGIVGIRTGMFGDILSLTPLNLLVSLALLLWNHEKWDSKFVVAITIVAAAGFFVEVAGVQTGLIFGEYTYGKTLGWHWLDVPLAMAVNWLILVYCAAAVVSRRTEWDIWLKAFAGAVIMVTMDFLIEPVAIKYDFWEWANGVIPSQNYLAWGLISFGLLMVFHRLVPPVDNKVAIVLFFLQIVFFVVLNMPSSTIGF